MVPLPGGHPAKVPWLAGAVAFAVAAAAYAAEAADRNLSNPYWNYYHAVIFKAVCDSTGAVRSTELLYDFDSGANINSLAADLRQTRFDVTTTSGKIRRWRFRETPTDSDVHFIVPFPTRADTAVAVPGLFSRRGLEEAGLGPWLAIWDTVLPDWPVERWKVGRSSMHAFPEYRVTDSSRVALGMVSISPDGVWGLDPFYGAGVSEDGRVGYDVDGGYTLYRRGETGYRQQVTGTSSAYDAAGWIDSTRFVVAATEGTWLGYPPGTGVSFRAPLLILGDVSHPEVLYLEAPPIPVPVMEQVMKRLDAYRHQRYPKVWGGQGPR